MSDPGRDPAFEAEPARHVSVAYLVMVAVAIACLPIFMTGYSIGRLEALVFLGYYAAYVAYLVLAAQEHDALPAYSRVVMEFAVPLTALGLAVTFWRTRKRGGLAPY